MYEIKDALEVRKMERKMMKNKCFKCLLVGLAGIAFSAVADRPNVVIILADDFGIGGVNAIVDSGGLIDTPNMDRLVANGISFTDASTPSSVCSPSRYGMLTGEYAWRTRLKWGVVAAAGFKNNEGNFDLLIDTETETIASYLKKAGYHTAHVGKWHLGYTNEDVLKTYVQQPLVPGPRNIGFDYHFAVPHNLGDVAKVYIENEGVYQLRSKKVKQYRGEFNKLYHGYDAPQRVAREVTQKITDKACDWMRDVSAASPEDPFFLYFAPVAVHSPIVSSVKNEGASKAGAYGDFIQDLDDSVGQIVDQLELLGKLENTLLIFTSDNGADFSPPQKPQGIAKAAGLKLNGDLRGDKHTIFQGGFIVPFIVHWPNEIKSARTSNRTISLVDIFSTIKELVPVKGGESTSCAPDSVSFASSIFSADADAVERGPFVTHSALGLYAVRHKQWKYIEGRFPESVPLGKRKNATNQAVPQLYDLNADPKEENNLFGTHPEVVSQLQGMLDSIRDREAK
ncbi:sulfatase family protein [Pontiella sulfatireligans]|uniref:Arylsulfatase n=1 Tax=Pontiella sulfatireligans TaxID=2750658 RepID=A0A6C2UTT7_9BACT|nr:arylsulfatase [Pontiella sulfatireligans]SPS74595.1 sulfatase S1_15 [Kiritimatiellales bacterium]VGO23589.1 Arylsulfatase [Pontiella sulfatireligans]